MSEKTKSEKDLKTLRRVRFFRTTHAGDRVLEFSLVIRHRIENYRLVEGEVCEIPQYVVNHISQIKDVVHYSNAETGEERVSEKPLYHCEIIE